MNKKRIKNLIHKYLLGKLNNEELASLKNEFSNDEVRELFKEFAEVHFLLSNELTNVDSESAYRDFISSINPSAKLTEKKSFINFTFLRYAAAFISIIGLTYFFMQQHNSIPSNTKLELGNEAITLELENGDILVIDEDKEQRIVNKKGSLVSIQQGNKLNYVKNTKQEVLVFNKLVVPYGKKFQVLLSDGTKVDLNSGTTFRYPEYFIEGEDRMVFIEEGEVYFDVAKNKINPFIVNVKNMNIRVTGTEFNVSCYSEDENIDTALVEGGVSLYGENELYNDKTSVKIIPGELATWDKEEKIISVSKVDLSIYTGWKEGVLVFKHMKFKDIVTKLERHYNLTIKNEDQVLGDEILTARFENSTIEHVLKSFKDIYAINYSIVDNQIIINKN